MSQISATSVTSLNQGMNVSGLSISTQGGLTPTGGGTAGEVGSTSTTNSLSYGSQTLNLSSSRMSLSSATGSSNDKLAAMVLALIEIVLGLNSKDKDDDKKMLAGLLGLLALSANRGSGNELQSLELTQSSQVMQMTTTTNSSAIQASAYTRSAGGADSGGGASGGTLNIVA